VGRVAAVDAIRFSAAAQAETRFEADSAEQDGIGSVALDDTGSDLPNEFAIRTIE
jgi:hypothetical protein